MEHQYLFDVAGKRFTKESGSLKGSPGAFIRYEYSESKKPNPAPFIESTNFHFAIFSNSNQLISKLNECPKIFVCNFQISSQAPDFLSHLITPSHSLSHLITRYPLGWKKNHFRLATFKLVRRLLIFYHILSRLVTPYHTLSHLIPWVGQKTIFIWQL